MQLVVLHEVVVAREIVIRDVVNGLNLDALPERARETLGDHEQVRDQRVRKIDKVPKVLPWNEHQVMVVDRMKVDQRVAALVGVDDDLVVVVLAERASLHGSHSRPLTRSPHRQTPALSPTE